MTTAQIIASLGPVRFEASCVVEDDPGEVVRHAAPLDAHALRRHSSSRPLGGAAEQEG